MNLSITKLYLFKLELENKEKTPSVTDMTETAAGCKERGYLKLNTKSNWT